MSLAFSGSNSPEVDNDNIHHTKQFLEIGTAFLGTIIVLFILNFLISGNWFDHLESPEILFWIFLCCIKTVFIIVCIFNIRNINKGLKPKDEIQKKKTHTYSFLTLLIFIPLFLPLIGMYDLWFFSIKFILFTAITAWVAWQDIEGIWYLHAKFDALQTHIQETCKNEESVERFIDYRSTLQKLLQMNGTIIGLSTLAAGAMRTAIQASTGRHVPQEYVIIYGAYFTFVLAVIYIPTYLQSMEVGKALLDSHCGLSADHSKTADKSEWIKWYEHRKHFKEYLDLNEGAGIHLQKGMSIFSPVMGSIVGVLMGVK